VLNQIALRRHQGRALPAPCNPLGPVDLETLPPLVGVLCDPRAAGLPENPGFDLLSCRPDGEKRSIEVKGRAGTSDIEVSANEWAKACNLRERYWLYVVYDCATPNPRLVRVRDPFGNLLAKAKGSVLISAREITQAEVSDG